MRNYPWPGNVRELRNVIERAVIITQGSTLRLIDDLDSQALELDLHEQIVAQSAFGDSVATGETLEQTEYNLILRTLKNVHWKVEGPGGAARLLNIHPSTLRSKMRKLGIERPRYSGHRLNICASLWRLMNAIASSAFATQTGISTSSGLMSGVSAESIASRTTRQDPATSVLPGAVVCVRGDELGATARSSSSPAQCRCHRAQR